MTKTISNKNNHLLRQSCFGWNFSTGSTDLCVVLSSTWHGNGETQTAPKRLRCSSCGLSVCAGERFEPNISDHSYSLIFSLIKKNKKKLSRHTNRKRSPDVKWRHPRLFKKRLFNKFPVLWHFSPSFWFTQQGLWCTACEFFAVKLCEPTCTPSQLDVMLLVTVRKQAKPVGVFWMQAFPIY